MFFRRKRPKPITFDDRLESIRRAGFTVSPLAGGRYKITRGNCACVLENAGGTPRVVERAGMISGNEIGKLSDAGFQKFFVTPSGKRKPALADELEALHAFQEDLREALGQISLYNESLGTVSTYYLYDRVENRDAPRAPAPSNS